jgi:hypothetical protein
VVVVAEPAVVVALSLPLLVLVGTVIMLAFPRTRRAGAIVLGIEGLLVLVAGFFAWMRWSMPPPAPASWVVDRRIDRRVPPSSPAAVPQAGETSIPPRAEIDPNTEGLREPPKKPSAHPAAETEGALPAWVGRPPQASGDVYRTSITIGPYTTRAECDAKLSEEVQKVLNQYVEKCLGEPLLAGVVLPESEFHQAIVKDQREEVRQYSIGPMVSLHVLLEFDRSVKERILEQWRRAAIGRRIWVLGAGLASLLGVLAGVYGYLRVRTPNS